MGNRLVIMQKHYKKHLIQLKVYCKWRVMLRNIDFLVCLICRVTSWILRYAMSKTRSNLQMIQLWYSQYRLKHCLNISIWIMKLCRWRNNSIHLVWKFSNLKLFLLTCPIISSKTLILKLKIYKLIKISV